MAVYTADTYFVGHKEPVDEASLPDADSTIEGDKVVWVLDSAVSGAVAVTVRNYDKSRFGCYRGKKPCIVIKSAIDTSANNVTIDDEDGTTLFTFAADNSATPAYVALTIDSAGDWELV
jgi:hypothetical protein